jgi:2-keto-4-pentenoate hydratase/2-oxohepta-3-ene-1,7-dioic acid hydratase in catechol pathway
MKIARFKLNEELRYGIVDGPELVVLKGHPLANNYETTGERVPLKEVKLLAPTMPSKVICVGKNYAAHAAEIGEDITDEPLLFLKPNSAVVGPGDAIVIPMLSDQIELEAELAIVIGELAKNVSESEAMSKIWGFTIANDVTARDLQFKDGQWARSKAFDTFCPLGPWIETEWLPEDQMIQSRVDGVTRQNSPVSDMIHSIPSIIKAVSEVMTLLPGDVILTGSPAGVGIIRPGEIVECEVDGIGTLINPVVHA